MADSGLLLINNQWRETPERISVVNPYSGKPVGRVCRAAGGDLQDAAQTAVRAFPAMRALASHEKSLILRQVAEGIRDRREEFARTIALESGKPITAARGEVARAVTTFTVASEEACRLGGEVLPLDIAPASAGRMAVTRRFPIGPVLAITPFNFPLNLVAHKVASALAAGNTVVLKPSSATPLTALKLGQVLLDAGMPPGAVNIVVCPGGEIEALVHDERIRLVSFTGSPGVGWKIKSDCGKKKVALELGGNAGVVIEPDADLDTAVDRCVFGGYVNAGQVCIALQRIYVAEEIYPQFRERFVAKVKALKTGDPLSDDTFVGPLITGEDVQRVHDWVEEARGAGARVLAGGRPDGSVYVPTVLENAAADLRCVRDEIFGPVTVLFPYRGFEQALDAVNDSVYGLQAGVFTKNIENILKAFNRLEVGGVMVNDVPTFRVDNFPYGGIKNSGFGREGVRYAIEEMTEIRVLVLHNTA